MSRLSPSAPNPLLEARDLRLPRIADPCVLVMFGITGDLARHKLLPAVYDLANRGLLSPRFCLVGVGRRPWGDESMRRYVKQAARSGARTPWRPAIWEQLAAGMRFVEFSSFEDDVAYQSLTDVVTSLDASRGTGGNRAFYLSIPPGWFPAVTERIARSGLVDEAVGSWRRVVVEKPFGHDRASARKLDELVGRIVRPDDVFRVDHYLGKETVQNILALRFANTMLEPLWNQRYVDHVQVTMAEDIGIGTRAGYYDMIGSARDVIQNHLLQLLALTAMEEPTSMEAHAVRTEKEKVLDAVRLERDGVLDLGLSTARGRYGVGFQGGQRVRSYLEEDGVAPGSRTETYAAVRLEIANRRWAGVPFYLRAGKRLARRVTEVAVVFKQPPFLPFGQAATAGLGANTIVLRIQPDEGITLRLASKVPGTQMELRDVTMDFGYGASFNEESPEAYERLILDALLGDAPLFPHQREVDLSWRILDPVIEHWASSGVPEEYRPGSWGPSSAHDLLARDGRTWRRS
ncbi:glucose-6-phosphate dehydrogenase [Actinomyces sp. 2119]|uniref:Glucose-6-phosphate 1-dehydrogenase n=1 Tax=Actinomyces lilanjuaniae TaxID=2321394 RepID=A0ABN5PU18_9ACTO|nr:MULTISPECIES: glucose-6-phosphate dehydrogenase [Actinomyces]AYD90857.1 glucose-6-phosphate dehydrogenase [Actinomyces lilanjuaniae]RJF44958.1 glucose-6-phosphate dehydrogenase [Actinomyces sp. 2119]